LNFEFKLRQAGGVKPEIIDPNRFVPEEGEVDSGVKKPC
jgi:hypothetical protein